MADTSVSGPRSSVDPRALRESMMRGSIAGGRFSVVNNVMMPVTHTSGNRGILGCSCTVATIVLFLLAAGVTTLVFTGLHHLPVYGYGIGGGILFFATLITLVARRCCPMNKGQVSPPSGSRASQVGRIGVDSALQGGAAPKRAASNREPSASTAGSQGARASMAKGSGQGASASAANASGARGSVTAEEMVEADIGQASSARNPLLTGFVASIINKPKDFLLPTIITMQGETTILMYSHYTEEDSNLHFQDPTGKNMVIHSTYPVEAIDFNVLVEGDLPADPEDVAQMSNVRKDGDILVVPAGVRERKIIAWLPNSSEYCIEVKDTKKDEIVYSVFMNGQKVTRFEWGAKAEKKAV